MNIAWESPLPELGHALHSPHQVSCSPTSTPTWTPPDHFSMQQSTLPSCATVGTLSTFPKVPMTFDWTQFYSDILCHIWFRQDKHVASQSTSPILGYLTPPSKSRTPLTRPTVAFRCFVQRVIQATAVSQAVLVLSLWYIERLRSRNVAAVASPGSEYRLCATGLMLANKYLDDNTYTSKTWSGMTGIPLSEMNLMEIEFLSSLDHKVGISDEAYLGWLDYLGKMALSFAQPQLVQQYPIAPADYRFTFQSNNPHSDYTGASYYDRARSSSPHHVPRVQSNQVYGDSSVPESSERIVSDPMTGMENGDRRGDNTAMPRKRPALEFRHDQPMQIVRRMRSAQHAGRRASARQLLNGTQEASLMPVSACSDPWQDGSLEISASVPPPSLASYQLPVTSYATVPVLHTDETTDRHMPISHVSNEMGYLQLPYDYRLGFQPRVEDLTFYQLKASPIQDEYLYYQNQHFQSEHPDHIARVGKPRIQMHGQYQPSAPPAYKQTNCNNQSILPGTNSYQAQYMMPRSYWPGYESAPRRSSAPDLGPQPEYAYGMPYTINTNPSA